MVLGQGMYSPRLPPAHMDGQSQLPPQEKLAPGFLLLPCSLVISYILLGGLGLETRYGILYAVQP